MSPFVPESGATLTMRLHKEKHFKERPLDRALVIHAAPPTAKVQNMVVWTFDGLRYDGFESSVRVALKASPIRYTFEAFDVSDAPEGAFSTPPPPLIASRDYEIAGRDAYTKCEIAFDAHAARRIGLRISVQMANAQDANSYATTELVNPVLKCRATAG
jgi:hypothetical protein